MSDGFLVDYDEVKIASEIALKGHFLKEGEEVGLRDTTTGQLKMDFVEDERELPAGTLEHDWTAPDHNRKVVEELAKHLREQEHDLGHFPKTLVFASNDLPHRSHADQLVRMLRDEFGRGAEFVQKITGSPSVDRPLEKIRRFRNRPEPGIVVTVDLLSTGVDIPALENVVFLRGVKSRILFEQMLGRVGLAGSCRDLTPSPLLNCISGEGRVICVGYGVERGEVRTTRPASRRGTVRASGWGGPC